MSDEAIASAVKALAESNLDLCTELKNSRIVQQQMATTLVQIYEGQKGLVEQLEEIVRRANVHERHQSDSDAKLRIVSEKVERHEEWIQAAEKVRRPVGSSRPGR